jgi:hypothetical protein
VIPTRVSDKVSDGRKGEDQSSLEIVCSQDSAQVAYVKIGLVNLPGIELSVHLPLVTESNMYREEFDSAAMVTSHDLENDFTARLDRCKSLVDLDSGLDFMGDER